jgi:hypothetical protein
MDHATTHDMPGPLTITEGPDQIDFGSPFDIAYGMDEQALALMPAPLLESSGGMPAEPAPARPWRRAAIGIACAVAAGAAVAAALFEGLA